ncbi:MAG TPA: hypothetical protein VN950_01285 [Terriglobales bacterium]|nr:hypothetical protein [Terriglobales bacterium]
MIELRQVGREHKEPVWQKFAPFHYDKETFNKASECYLVSIDGKVLGFIASLQRSNVYDARPMWTAHKTAVRLPSTHPDYLRLWALCADEQAKLHVARGHRFVAMAPLDHSHYRTLPNSGWEPSTKDKQRMKRGYHSHKYIGVTAKA